MKYKTTQVFVPGGMPDHTYISRISKDLESKIESVKDNLCKLLAVTGPTKSGKTVLVNRMFPRSAQENRWIDGGTIENENDLWQFILCEIQGYDSVEISENDESLKKVSGEIEGSIPLISKAKVGTSLDKKKSTTHKKSLKLSPKSAAIKQLQTHKPAIIIDDFHYLSRTLQGSIIRALKPLIFEGEPIILIAIPHRRYDAVKVEREITGRLETIQVPSWDTNELLEIPNSGFPLLKIVIPKNLMEKLANESYGSPHLMQEFCRELAFMNSVKETAVNTISINEIPDELFKKVAAGTGRVIFDKLSKGPRPRSDRILRTLFNGDKVDIYKAILFALSRIKPGLQTIEYEQLRSAIKEILVEKVPQLQEISRVLDKMSSIAAKDESSTPVIEWDKEDRYLHITDPFFAFFLKWGVEF